MAAKASWHRNYVTDTLCIVGHHCLCQYGGPTPLKTDLASSADYETFRRLPSMSKRTIRIRDEGGWQRRLGDDAAAAAATVEQKLNTD